MCYLRETFGTTLLKKSVVVFITRKFYITAVDYNRSLKRYITTVHIVMGIFLKYF